MVRISGYSPLDYPDRYYDAYRSCQAIGLTTIQNWCKDHCRNPWCWGYEDTSLNIRFQDPDDAVLFKLTWM